MTVTMPGKITETNGEKVSDETVRFNLNDFSKENSYFVKSEKSFNFTPILLICGAGILVIGGIVIFKKKKNK